METVEFCEGRSGSFVSSSEETTHRFPCIVSHQVIPVIFENRETSDRLGEEWSKKVLHLLFPEIGGVVLVFETTTGFDGYPSKSKAWNRNKEIRVVYLPDGYVGYSKEVDYYRYDSDGLRIL